MSKITVHSFHVYDPMQDAFVLARGKVTLETILAKGYRVAPNTEEDIDSSQLNDTGRYHSKSSET